MLTTHIEKTVLLTGGSYYIDTAILTGSSTPLFTIDFLNVAATPIQIEWPTSGVSMNATGNYVKPSGRATLSLWSVSGTTYSFAMTGEIVSSSGINGELAQHIQDGAKAFMNAAIISSDAEAYMKPDYFGKTLLIWPSVTSFSLGVSHLAVGTTPWFSIDIVNLSTTPLTFSKPTALTLSCASGDRLASFGRCTITMFGSNAHSGSPVFYAVITGDMTSADGTNLSVLTTVQNASNAVVAVHGEPVGFVDAHRNKIVEFTTGTNNYTIDGYNIAYTEGMPFFDVWIINGSSTSLTVSGVNNVSITSANAHYKVAAYGMARLRLWRYSIVEDWTVGPLYSFMFLLSGDLIA